MEAKRTTTKRMFAFKNNNRLNDCCLINVKWKIFLTFSDGIK